MPSTDRSGDADLARLSVQLEEHRARAVLAHLAGRQVPDDERLAALDLDGDLLARLQAVEEVRRRNRRRVAVLLPSARDSRGRPAGRAGTTARPRRAARARSSSAISRPPPRNRPAAAPRRAGPSIGFDARRVAGRSPETASASRLPARRAAPASSRRRCAGSSARPRAVRTSFAVRSLVTMNSARSPTTLLDGVTLTMSPKS